MTGTVKPIPDAYRQATPYLCIKDAASAIEFYRKAFGAKELERMTEPDGKIGHAEIQIGEARIMLADEYPALDFRSPKSLGGSPVLIFLYVEDVDAFFQRAIEAGATVRQPLEDKFYGDRSGTLEEPFGHIWSFATHKEDVPPEEMKRRFEAQARAGKRE